MPAQRQRPYVQTGWPTHRGCVFGRCWSAAPCRLDAETDRAGHRAQETGAFRHRSIDHLAFTRLTRVPQCSQDSGDEKHGVATEVGHVIDGRNGRPGRAPDAVQQSTDREVGDVVTSSFATGDQTDPIQSSGRRPERGCPRPADQGRARGAQPHPNGIPPSPRHTCPPHGGQRPPLRYAQIDGHRLPPAPQGAAS